MQYHFYDCYTPDEVKTRYRALAKKFHPDKNGTSSQFQELQNQYEQKLSQATNEPKLPPLFHVERHYEYFGKKVTYYQRDNHYYKFHKEGGADIQIDSSHLFLIKTENRIAA